MKLCRGCDTHKDRSEFHKRAASGDGLQARCKQCVQQAQVAKSGGRTLKLRELALVGKTLCSKCGAEFLIDEMPRDRSRTTGPCAGRTTDCYACRRARKVDPAKQREYIAKYRATPLGQATQKTNYERNKEAAFERARRRRAVKRGATCASSEELKAWSRIVLHDPCAYCGTTERKITLDHVVPLSRGGEHGPANLVGVCEYCNKSKSTKTILEFLLA